MTTFRALLAATLFPFLLLSPPALAEDPTPGYNTKIPEGLLTPDKYPTRVGDIEFFDGIPTAATAEALYNHLDYIRGVQTFLNGMPAASLEAIRRSQAEDGKTQSNRAVIFDELMDFEPAIPDWQHRYRLSQHHSRP